MVKIFNQHFTDTIWSLGYWGAPKDLNIWIETRNHDTHSWFNYNFNIKQVTSIQNSSPNTLNWLCGLKDGGIFLQLKTGKNPGIEKLICFNLPRGDLRYSIELSQWTSLEGENLVTNKGTIDLNTGFINKVKDVNLVSASIESPIHFEESQPEFKAFSTLFEQKFNEKIVKGIDYWEGSNKLIFSYYIYDNAWKNQLRICDYAFQTLFIETIAEGEQMGYHTFQLVENKLVFIKDKHELFIYADH